MELFGERLKKLRESKDMTQETLGKILNLTQSIISHYESNRKQPGRQTVIRIAKFFNVPIDYLYGLTDDPTPAKQKNPTKEPTNEEYVLAVKTLGDGLIKVAELVNTKGIDDIEAMRLSSLVFRKFGTTSVSNAERAAWNKIDIPGSGALDDEEDD